MTNKEYSIIYTAMIEAIVAVCWYVLKEKYGASLFTESGSCDIMDADWNEEDHPRKENGQFGKGGGGNTALSDAQKQNLNAIAEKLGVAVGSPMTSEEALFGANFSWNEKQHSANMLPTSPSNAQTYTYSNNPDDKKEFEKWRAEYARTRGALSKGEQKEISQYTVNCPSTVIAYELRERGLDVTALPVTSSKGGPSVFNNLIWQSAQIQQARDGAHFEELTKNDPDNARYGVIVSNDYTDHTMVAKREKGRLKIIDTQLNAIYDPKVLRVATMTDRNYIPPYKYTPRTENYELHTFKNGIIDKKIFGKNMDADTAIAFYRIDNLTLDAHKVSKYVRKK